MENNRQEAITKLVEVALAYNQDDVANNASHYARQMEELRSTMLAEDIAEAERQFGALWATQTHYCSGVPIQHQ